jgi:hypothetical protein
MGRGAEWLEEAAAIDRKTPGAPSRSRQLILELRELTGADVTLTQRFIPFPRSVLNPQTKRMEVWVNRVIAPFGTDLYQLADEIREIASTVFNPAGITRWIFTGIRPLIPRLQISESATFQGAVSAVNLPPRSSATITIHARDLTWEELLRAYHVIRSTPNAKRQKVSPLHLRIYQLVRERGGRGSLIPAEHGKKREFWESILKEIQKDKRFKSQSPSGWEAIRKAYLTVVSMKEANYGRIRQGKAKS